MQKVRFWDPQHWRFRAEETRTVADQMTHEESRTIMRRIALDYDQLAKLAEEQLAESGKKSDWRLTLTAVPDWRSHDVCRLVKETGPDRFG